MKFLEFDPSKSKSNKEKHGISFEEAEPLFQKSNKYFIGRHLHWNYEFQPEGREKVLFEDGNGGYWVCVFSDRNLAEGIRPISIHRLLETQSGGLIVDVSKELVDSYERISKASGNSPKVLKEFWKTWEKRLAYGKKRDSETERKLRDN